MGKLELNKQQKLSALLNTALGLFTTQGVNKTSIAEISQKAGIAKGTFYLYFKDKYDIRNYLVSHESSKLFRNANSALEEDAKKTGKTYTIADKIVFIVNNVIDQLNENQKLLTFISKNLSWGIFKEALTTKVSENDINFKDVYMKMVNEDGHLEEPEIMLFLIVELVSSTCYSAILYNEPSDINSIKPYLFSAIRSIVKEHSAFAED